MVYRSEEIEDPVFAILQDDVVSKLIFRKPDRTFFEVPIGGGAGGGGVASVTAGNGTVVVAGTAANPTISVGTGIAQTAIVGLTAALDAKAPTASPTFTGTATFASIVVPGAGGATSVVIGPSATAAGAGATAYGSSAKADGLNSVAVGFDSRATQQQTVAIGVSSRANISGQATAVGYSAKAEGSSGACAFGYAATAPATSAIAIGNSAQALAASSICIGSTSSVEAGMTGAVVIGVGATATVGTSGGGMCVAIGHLSHAGDWRATAVGYSAKADAVSASAFGWAARASETHAVSLGRGAFSSGPGSMNLGFSGGSTAFNVWFDNSHTSKYVPWNGGTTVDRTPTLCPIVLHGMSGRDTTATPTSDRAGGDFIVAAGQGTGTAIGGSVRLQTSLAGGVSATTENALVTVIQTGAIGTSRALAFFGGALATKPTGVAVDAASIHAALVSLSLIAA